MTSFYIVLKVIAFIAIIIVPLSGPKKKKSAIKGDIGKLAVNGEGYLESVSSSPANHHPVQ
jgi:hypothetical protein